MKRWPASRGGTDTCSALLHALAAALARGYWKVACRRYLMIRARGWPVPAHLQAACEQNLVRCTEGERARMLRDAQAWASIASPRMRVAGQDAPPAIGEAPPQEPVVQPAVPARTRPPARELLATSAPAASLVRTHWRPLPACFLASRTAGGGLAARR